MRIRHINTERGWRGGERQTLLTLKGMRAMGQTVELFARMGTELSELALNEGMIVHSGIGFFSLFVWLLFNAKNFDILHSHNASSSTALAVYRCFGAVRSIFTRRTDFASDRRGGKRLKAWLRRLKWKRFDQVVAISHSAALEPIRLGLRPVIIRSAVPTVMPDQARIQRLLMTHRLSGKTLIGTAAVFTADKDPLTSIRVAAEVCKKNPDVVFLHLGTGGELEAISKNYAADLGLTDRYLFLGFISNPEEVYAAFSAFFLTSRAEALGTCVLDAMTQRIPVVATNVGGLKETLAGGRGLLAEPEDAEGLAEHLFTALSRAPLISGMVERAYYYATLEHNVKTMSEQYLNLYRRLSG